MGQPETNDAISSAYDTLNCKEIFFWCILLMMLDISSFLEGNSEDLDLANIRND